MQFLEYLEERSLVPAEGQVIPSLLKQVADALIPISPGDIRRNEVVLGFVDLDESRSIGKKGTPIILREVNGVAQVIQATKARPEIRLAIATLGGKMVREWCRIGPDSPMSPLTEADFKAGNHPTLLRYSLVTKLFALSYKVKELESQGINASARYIVISDGGDNSPNPATRVKLHQVEFAMKMFRSLEGSEAFAVAIGRDAKAEAIAKAAFLKMNFPEDHILVGNSGSLDAVAEGLQRFSGSILNERR